MFMLTVTQRGDVCHIKWKHRALCSCIWIEKTDFCGNTDTILVDTAHRMLLLSAGLTEHLCHLDFHLPEETLDSENMIFLCSLVLAETMWLVTFPFLISIGASCTVS